jgi:hypothetical protein
MHHRTTNLSLTVLLLTLAATLSGCDFQLGGGSDNNTNGDNGGNSNDDDGGAAFGVLTDASSLELNTSSDFSLAGDAVVFLDSVAVDSDQFEDGMVAKVTLEEDAPSSLATGRITRIEVNHQVIGPVTQVTPLHVLGQEITVIDDTELEGVSDEDTNTLNLGDVVRVSGFNNRSNGILATRLDVPTGGSEFWRLTGTVSSYEADSQFLLDETTVILNGTVPSCALADGQLVAVTLTPITDFAQGDDVASVTAVDCLTLALPELENNEENVNSLPATMEGFVTDISGVQDITIENQPVELQNSVNYSGGSASDLIIGTRIQATGTLNLTTNVLEVDTISFPLRPIFIEAPITSSDVTSNTSVNFFGKEITTNNLVVEYGELFGGGNDSAQVRLWGFVDEEQEAYAITLEEVGSANDEDVTLQGPVSQVNNSTFEIMDIRVDGDAAANAVAGLVEEDLVLVENAETNGDTSITTGTVETID